MKKSLFAFALLLSIAAHSQDSIRKDSVSFLFIGDIMGHGTQIAAAYDDSTQTYDYQNVFHKVAPLIKQVDFAVANLEVTLAGEPYKGYPQFSSPDALAISCKENGIDILMTANNHACDRRKNGILRTIKVLDSLKIPHTGTFENSNQRWANNLLIIEKNNIRVGLLNYTYGTNGLPAPPPTIVNKIDTLLMCYDIHQSEKEALDKLIVMIHWGTEYKLHPSKEQEKIAKFLFENGVDIIIGSHPHVLQKMEYWHKSDENKEQLIVYSLGNFVSNQRTAPRDGGAMIQFTLSKEKGETTISQKGYYLTWVHKPSINDKKTFEILPCSIYEQNNFDGMNTSSIEKMKKYTTTARTLLNEENHLVEEIKAVPSSE